ncbi:MAG: AHH domain-containing protein, partial [bacterium]|nr:AHH domain-containing protein [bacterium]
QMLRYSYDAAGNLTGITDRSGSTQQFEYDALDRLMEESWLEEGLTINQLSRTYDAVGNLLSISGNSGTYRYSYDTRDRLLSQTMEDSVTGVALELDYFYDAVGNLIAVSDHAGSTVASTYNERDELTRRTWSGGRLAPARMDFNYDPRGYRTSAERFADLEATQRVGRSEWQRDTRGRTTQVRHLDALDQVLADFDYVYDLADQLVEQTSNGDTSRYAYDAAGQLLQAEHSHRPDENYAYDVNGNRLNNGEQIGSDNRILSDAEADYAYDADGNLTRRLIRASGEIWEYSYDHRQRLTDVVQWDAAGDALLSVQYVYDVFDRRVQRIVDADGDGPLSAVATSTVYDGWHAWADVDAAGEVTRQYLYGDVIDELLARDSDSGTDWYLSDRQLSVRGIVDSSGGWINELEYDSFGRTLSQTHPEVGDRFQYTGREWDSATGLYDYRARNYDPGLGRFLSQDPIGFLAGDTNLYRYVNNSPINFVDPFGLTAAGEQGGIHSKESKEAPQKTFLGCASSAGLQAGAQAIIGLPTGAVDLTIDIMLCTAGAVPSKGPLKGWTQSTADSQVLARNLGIQPGSGLDAHHIVAGEHRRAAAARRLLDRYQIDVNDAANGVTVVGGRGAPQTVLPRHHRGGGLHSYRGLDEVNDRLGQAIDGVDDWATGRQRILDELAKIRDEILNGTFPN